MDLDTLRKWFMPFLERVAFFRGFRLFSCFSFFRVFRLVFGTISRRDYELTKSKKTFLKN